MEEEYIAESVKKRLILSGLKELDKHGVRDFSLRRVAIDAGVSCAAPYRHFKDKDELISEIIGYVFDGWVLLSERIFEIFSADARALVTELSVSGLRFFIANGNFRTVLMTANAVGQNGSRGLDIFDGPITEAVRRLCEAEKREDGELLVFKIRSMLYGAIMLVDGGYENADVAADNLKKSIIGELDA